MTREEAIEIINRENDPNDKKVWEVFPEYREALDMAIKALSQEPTVTSTDEPMTMVYPTIVCDDAISREAVKDILNNSYRLTDAEHRVEQLPSVTHKSGKWIEHPEIETTTPEYLMFYECSECGDKPCFCKSDIHKKRFCSNCGAKMESEVNNG